MTCKFLYGNSIAKKIREELSSKIKNSKKTPHLVAVIVGDDPSSKIYVGKKIDACNEVGIKGTVVNLPNTSYLKSKIQELNEQNSVDGYILQLPLPEKEDPIPYFSMIRPSKDLDVFNPLNVGLLVQNNPYLKPCTPKAVQVLLQQSGIKVSGKKVVIINRSNVVGKPLANMMIQDCDVFSNATVTICHDKTPPSVLKEMTKTSDIIVVAVGIPNFINSDMLKEGHQVIIDVGINRVGKKIYGDVNPEVYKDDSKTISPVPGGVGPLTVTMLLENAFLSSLNVF